MAVGVFLLLLLVLLLLLGFLFVCLFWGIGGILLFVCFTIQYELHWCVSLEPYAHDMDHYIAILDGSESNKSYTATATAFTLI